MRHFPSFLFAAVAHSTVGVLGSLASAPLRRVLVTGGNKGIGLQICRKILSEHADCGVFLGSRDQSRGDEAVRKLLEEDPKNQGRVEALELDVSDENSVRAAAQRLREKASDKEPLYGIVNNAGIGFGHSIPETLNTNLYGVRRVCDSFLPLLRKEGGRVVNIASASGPNFVSRLETSEKSLFTSPSTSWSELKEAMDRYEKSGSSSDAYGLSKACVNVYTRQLAREHPDLRINSCSPGYILTDLTAGMGAVNTPENSNCHVAPLFLLFGEPEGNGRYYGSDAVRSPIDRYRGPGEPAYVADD